MLEANPRPSTTPLSDRFCVPDLDSTAIHSTLSAMTDAIGSAANHIAAKLIEATEYLSDIVSGASAKSDHSVLTDQQRVRYMAYREAKLHVRAHARKSTAPSELKSAATDNDDDKTLKASNTLKGKLHLSKIQLEARTQKMAAIPWSHFDKAVGIPVRTQNTKPVHSNPVPRAIYVPQRVHEKIAVSARQHNKTINTASKSPSASAGTTAAAPANSISTAPVGDSTMGLRQRLWHGVAKPFKAMARFVVRQTRSPTAYQRLKD